MNATVSPMTVTTVETIDWNKAWHRAYNNSSGQSRKKFNKSYWDDRAKHFSTIDNGALGRVQAMFQHLQINAATSILDIGCGPGNLSIPLAKTVKKVTAIDPAKNMIEILNGTAEKNNLTNITCLQKSWDELTPGEDFPQHDIVLASYALLMKDLQKALKKMDQAATETVCLFWFGGRESFGFDKLWPKLFNQEYTALPDHLYVLNLLNSLDIYANLSIIPQFHITHYEDMDNAVDCWAQKIEISDKKEIKLLRNHLPEFLEETSTGLVFRHAVCTAMIWWNKKQKCT